MINHIIYIVEAESPLLAVYRFIDAYPQYELIHNRLLTMCFSGEFRYNSDSCIIIIEETSNGFTFFIVQKPNKKEVEPVYD